MHHQHHQIITMHYHHLHMVVAVQHQWHQYQHQIVNNIIMQVIIIIITVSHDAPTIKMPSTSPTAYAHQKPLYTQQQFQQALNTSSNTNTTNNSNNSNTDQSDVYQRLQLLQHELNAERNAHKITKQQYEALLVENAQYKQKIQDLERNQFTERKLRLEAEQRLERVSGGGGYEPTIRRQSSSMLTEIPPPPPRQGNNNMPDSVHDNYNDHTIKSHDYQQQQHQQQMLLDAPTVKAPSRPNIPTLNNLGVTNNNNNNNTRP
eukprot:UN03206